MTEAWRWPLSPARTTVLAAALAISGVLVLGSLQPYRWQPQRRDSVWAELQREPFWQFDQLSRSDLIVNFTIGLPLGFFWLGAAAGGSRWRALTRAIPTAGWCLLQSFTVEALQHYFPPRIPAASDILAQGAGAAMGILAWVVAGPQVLRFAVGLMAVRHPAPAPLWALRVGVVVLLVSQLWPLDLLTSPSELSWKWRQGEILLVPFVSGELSAERLFGWGTQFTWWLMVGLWLGADHPRLRHLRTVIGLGGLLAVGVEAIQLLMLSAMADATHPVLALPALGLGWCLLGWTPLRQALTGYRSSSSSSSSSS